MPDPTTNYGWDVPTVGGSSGAWGTLLNAVFDEIDADLRAAENEAEAAQADADAATTTANAALPKAGGVMTGRVDLATATMDLISNAAANGTITLDISLAQYFALTTNGNMTVAFSNVPSGTFATGVMVRITAGGAHTVSWPASVDWSGGSAPVQTPSGTDLYVLVTDDSGTTWRGVRVGRSMS
jgi:hypothetical protein